MDWFLMLPTEVQIPVIGLAGSIVAIVGVAVRGRYARNPSKEREYRRPPLELKLSDSDRALIEQMGDKIEKHGEEISRHREELIRNPPPRRSTR